MSTPRRDDPIYKEIEEFKDYELTNCIAYEMLIRNREFIKTKEEIFSINKKLSELLYLRDKNLQKEFDKIYPSIFQYMDKKWFSTLQEYNDIYLLTFRKYIENKNIKYKTSYCKKIKELKTLSKEKLKKAKEKFGLVIDKNLLLWGQEISNTKRGNINTHVYGTAKYTGKNVALYDDLRHRIHGIENKDDIRDSKSFTELIFSRPILNFPSMKETNIKFNMDLPLSELEAQIREIKKQYDKDNTLIETAYDIFEHDDFLVSSLDEIIIKYPKKPKAEKLADWFFIYDLYNIKKKNSSKSDSTIFGDIDYELLEYYNSSKFNYYYTNTYRTSIMPLMRSLIDDCQYKQIITKKI